MSEQNIKREYKSGITLLILREIITARNTSNRENKLSFNKVQVSVLSISQVNYQEAVAVNLNTSEVNNLERADFY